MIHKLKVFNKINVYIYNHFFNPLDFNSIIS